MIERAAKAIAEEALRQDGLPGPEFYKIANEETLLPVFMIDSEVKAVESAPANLARLAFESIDVDGLARVLAKWDKDSLERRIGKARVIKAWLTG